MLQLTDQLALTQPDEKYATTNRSTSTNAPGREVCYN